MGSTLMRIGKADSQRFNSISLQSITGTMLIVFLLYIAVEAAGVFAPDGMTLRDILFTPVSRYLVMLCAILISVQLVAGFKKTAGTPLRVKWGVRLVLGSLLLFSASVWVSYLYRYEGRIAITPLKSVDPFPLNYLEMKRYLGSKSSPPEIGITIRNITLKSRRDPAQLAEVVADINYAGRGIDGFREGTLSSRFPMYLDNTFVSIVDAGYRVKYQVANIRNEVFDGGEADLKLIPSGSEDYFTMFAMGYNYALRCYPDYYDNNGVPATKSLNLNNPVFDLKISRFKVVNYKGLFTTKDRLKYENNILTLPSVSPWITVRFVRDHGIFVAAAGCVSLITGVLLLVLHRLLRPSPS